MLKTLAGFLNAKGGTLVIVSDDGGIGLHLDKFANEDKMALHLVNIIKSRLGVHAMTQLHIRFDDQDDERVMVVQCNSSQKPVFLKTTRLKRIFIRTGPASTEPSQTQEYITLWF